MHRSCSIETMYTIKGSCTVSTITPLGRIHAKFKANCCVESHMKTVFLTHFKFLLNIT